MSSFSLDALDHAMPLDTEILPVPTGGEDYEGSQERREAAASARAEGDFSKAVTLLTEAMELGNASTSILADRAHCLLQLRRPGAALADCNVALQLNPDSAKALKYRGLCNAYLGRWVEAKTDLAAAQSIDFNEDLEPSRRVAAERAAALEVAERERRLAEEEAARKKQQKDAEQRKKDRFLSDFSSQILTKKGNQSSAAALGPAKLIGVYFSAHWCPPCRQFTPMLAEMYDTIREEENDLIPGLGAGQHAFEVVFVSSDRDVKSFEEYYGSQPWMAIPFSEGRTSQELSSKFSVSGIPALFILNGEDGSVVDSDGRSTVMNARGDVKKLLKAWKLI